MKRLFVFAIFCCFVISCLADEPLFDAKLVPSIADNKLDFWFYTPPDTGPMIPVVKKVYPNQTFMLLIFCRVHPVESQTEANISYDMKLIDPDGKVAIEDKNRAYYQGLILKNKLILSDDHVLDMSFETSDMAGIYQIQMTFYETISKRNFSTSAEIELVKFKKPEPFTSDEEFSEWMMKYYQHPDPIRSFSSILYHVKTSSEWLEDNSMSLAFYRRIFLDNPFLWENYAKLYKSSPDEDKEKMLLVAAVVPAEKEKDVFLKDVKDEMRFFYNNASKTKIPDTDIKLTTAEQLDILWAEFFASGTYQPIKQIVSALGLKKHGGMLGVVSRSAEWSLISNCVQSHRVYQYCQMVYECETLDPDVKESLGVILATVEIKKREKETTGKKGTAK